MLKTTLVCTVVGRIAALCLTYCWAVAAQVGARQTGQDSHHPMPGLRRLQCGSGGRCPMLRCNWCLATRLPHAHNGHPS